MNKRKHERLRARNVAANLQVEGRLMLCSLENISLSGLFVRTDRQLPIGLPVVVDLARPGLRKALRLPGTVVRQSQEKAGIGVLFGPIEPDTKTRLEQLIREITAPPLPHTPQLPAAGRASGPASSSVIEAEFHDPDASKLTIQIKGLLMELGSRDQVLALKDRELESLRHELEVTRAALANRDERLRALGQGEAPSLSRVDVQGLQREAELALNHLRQVLELAKKG